MQTCARRSWVAPPQLFRALRLINADKQTWYIHGDGSGGDWADAIAHTRDGGQMPSGNIFFDLVQIAAAFAGVPLRTAPPTVPSNRPPAAPETAPPQTTIRWGEAIDTIALPRSLIKG
ncbi:hypothetical protein EKD04_023705 [Chloroflexales bacterium ZM16-3]|nr:hypothetical protein [Chloroflexales bacterium ZM16-3]